MVNLKSESGSYKCLLSTLHYLFFMIKNSVCIHSLTFLGGTYFKSKR